MSNEVIGRVNVMGRGVPSQAVFKDLRGYVIGNAVPAFNDDENIPQDADGHPDDKLPGVMVPKTEESAKILGLGVDTAQESLPELTVYVGMISMILHSEAPTPIITPQPASVDKVVPLNALVPSVDQGLCRSCCQQTQFQEAYNLSLVAKSIPLQPWS